MEYVAGGGESATTYTFIELPPSGYTYEFSCWLFSATEIRVVLGAGGGVHQSNRIIPAGQWTLCTHRGYATAPVAFLFISHDSGGGTAIYVDDVSFTVAPSGQLTQQHPVAGSARNSW